LKALAQNTGSSAMLKSQAQSKKETLSVAN